MTGCRVSTSNEIRFKISQFIQNNWFNEQTWKNGGNVGIHQKRLL